MAVLFLSHASKDDGHAAALEAWLGANGFTDVFVDHSAIAGGDKWREALRASAGSCRVVLFAVTENWLDSNECFNEFRAAWYMGKRIVPLFLLGPAAKRGAEAARRLTEVQAEDQGLDLTPCLGARGRLDIEADKRVADLLKAGLRAAGALARVGLDPEAFAIDRKLRPTPFPGLTSFGDDDADAALFYGRSGEIAKALEELRKVRAERDLRPFVILGASGAGKSSLLRAGIIPRLRREAPAWLPLRAFRPGADPLLNFAEALARTLGDFGRGEAHGPIRDRLMDAWTAAARDAKNALNPEGFAGLEAALEAEGARLREAAGRKAASILVSVDQAEEMARAEGRSGDALSDYLRVALAANLSPWQLAFTIRTDSFAELQGHRRFQNLEARMYDLRALPNFRFDSVVEEPAKRYGVAVETELVDALMEDAPKEDALPLLAFALQRLWHQYAETGQLTREHYDRVGGLNGLIEDAAERALRGIEPGQDVAMPAGPPSKRLLDIGAATFLPALVQINDQGATIRRVAEWKNFDDEAQDLLNRFDRWRLVVRKGAEAGGGTVEVAHEALFREWSRLKGWLEPERARLEALRALQADAAAWERSGKDAAFLNHRDKRLDEANGLERHEAYARRLTQVERDYLAACREADAAARKRVRRVKGLVGALVFGLIAVGAGWFNQPFLKERYHWYTTVRPWLLENVWPHVLTPEAETALKPGAQFRECAKDCPEMVVLPKGEFWMGSLDNQGDNDEHPRHKVTIGKSFAVSKYEVTFDDWEACVALGGCPKIGDSYGRGQQPLINVTWEEANIYLAWLSRMTGKTYRLLSEAEWEYSARGVTTADAPHPAYWWGEAASHEYANYGEDNCCSGKSEGRDEWYNTAPVGKFPANAFGLHDMHGNVWEWVEDCYVENYNDPQKDGNAVTSGDCSRRVVRGGSWGDPPEFLRSANRDGSTSGNRNSGLGFRVGRTLGP